MEEKLTAIKEAALNEIASVENSAALEEIRVKYLGKKGELTTILRGMGSLSPEERPVVGKLVNIAKNEVETKLEEVGSKIKEKEKKAKLASEVIDITLPGKKQVIVSGKSLLFLLANLVLAAGLSGYVGLKRAQVTGELDRIRAVMSDAGFREQYEASCKLEREVSEMAAQMAEEESLKSASSGFLDRTDFEAFAAAMEADMDVESLVYEKEAAIMEMTISQGNPGQVPSLVERIRDSGVFRSVSHSNWEQEEDNDAVRIHASIRAVLKEEAQDEEK